MSSLISGKFFLYFFLFNSISSVFSVLLSWKSWWLDVSSISGLLLYVLRVIFGFIFQTFIRIFISQQKFFFWIGQNPFLKFSFFIALYSIFRLSIFSNLRIIGLSKNSLPFSEWSLFLQVFFFFLQFILIFFCALFLNFRCFLIHISHLWIILIHSWFIIQLYWGVIHMPCHLFKVYSRF